MGKVSHGHLGAEWNMDQPHVDVATPGEERRKDVNPTGVYTLANKFLVVDVTWFCHLLLKACLRLKPMRPYTGLFWGVVLGKQVVSLHEAW